MLLRLTLPAIALLYATGCCCCGGGGSSSSSTKSSWREALEEEAAEAIAEKLVESATGAEDVEIGEDGTVSIKTAEGEAVFTGGDDKATLSMKGKDGETIDMGIGGDAKLPADFPFAMPSGSNVLFSTESTDADGSRTFMVMAEHPSGTLDDLVTHWEGELSAMGKINRTEMNQDGNRVIALVPEAERETAVAVSNTDGKLGTTITVKLAK